MNDFDIGVAALSLYLYTWRKREVLQLEHTMTQAGSSWCMGGTMGTSYET